MAYGSTLAPRAWMLGLAVFVLIALAVGTIAKAVVPGRDPGVGITMLLGIAAQLLGWGASQALGGFASAQPWSFILSVATATGLLFLYRETGLDQVLAQRSHQVGRDRREPAAMDQESLWVRIALAPAWAALGAVMLGATGFSIGFFGPMHLQPWANQGPMLGIFVTGPAGVILGGLIGGWLKLARPTWPVRLRVWSLNLATLAYGLLVLYLVADRSLWR